jgi:hypothetical protein
MGSQLPDTFPELLATAERTDGGMLYEARGFPGLAYRTRESRYNPTAALELDVTGRGIAPMLSTTVDDQQVRNDVTVKRTDGSSARAVRETGALSVETAGRRETQVEINASSDLLLSDHASWRLRLGTAEEQRYPRVTVDLDARPDLAHAAGLLDVGGMVTIDNLAADLVQQIVSGYTEVIGSHRRLITLNCLPAGTWIVGTLDDAALGRLDSDASQLTAAITASATSWQVSITDGPLWTVDPTEFPLDIVINGEVIRLSAISGTSSPQTFTVSARAINGVSRAHAAGTAVHVAHPIVLAL